MNSLVSSPLPLSLAAALVGAAWGAACAAPLEPPGAAPCDARAPVDRADDSDDPQVHVIYAVPADGVDRELDTDGTLALSVAAMGAWMEGETGGSRFRFDTCDGVVDITHHAMAGAHADYDDGAIRERVEAELETTVGYLDHKMYLVAYDGPGPGSCGTASYPGRAPGRTAVMWLQGIDQGGDLCAREKFSADGVTTERWELVAIHELLHVHGLVPSCAPTFLDTHTTTLADVMAGGSSLDPGNDDYYDHGRADCPDFKNSAFLEPTPPNAQLPTQF